MCGFAWFSFEDRSLLWSMARSLKNRAVDGETSFVDMWISLYHAHLSISDRDKETSQPYIQNGNIFSLVGEIYNKQHIIDTCWFAWDADNFTELEVVSMAYQKYGIELTKYINGEFSIFIFDSNRKKYFLFRDRWGTHTLYYRLHNGNIYFSSKIESLLLLQPQVSKIAISEYLTFQYCISPNTIVQDIYSLSPWYCLEFTDSKGITLHKFPPYKYHENHNSIIDCIESSVIRRIPKFQDKILIFLSWGLDSTLILYFLKKHFPWEIYACTFTGDKNQEDLDCAKKNTRKLGIRHYIVQTQNQNLITSLKENMFVHEWLIDLPDICNLLFHAYPHVADVKVVFTGDGKEEMILSNDNFRYKDISLRYEFFRKKNAIGAYSIDTRFLNLSLFDFNLQLYDKITLWNGIEVRMPLVDYELMPYFWYKTYKQEVSKFLEGKWLEFIPIGKEFWFRHWLGIQYYYDKNILEKQKALFGYYNTKYKELFQWQTL